MATEAPLPKIKRKATRGINLQPRSAPACDVGDEARLSCGVATVPTVAVEDNCRVAVLGLVCSCLTRPPAPAVAFSPLERIFAVKGVDAAAFDTDDDDD